MRQAPRLEPNSAADGTVDGPHVRAIALAEARLEYVRRTLAAEGVSPGDTSALVVGSGRGVLARGLAGLGFEVTAVDGSDQATVLARAADTTTEGRTTYRTERPDQLEPGRRFDLVYYADTFERTLDLEAVLARAADVVRPGGLLLYDTVNRTVLSRLVYLGAFQAIPMTAIVPRGWYAAARLRRPSDVGAALRRHGFRERDVCAFKPTSAPSLIGAVLARRRGEISDDEVRQRVQFTLAPKEPPLVTYLGSAIRE